MMTEDADERPAERPAVLTARLTMRFGDRVVDDLALTIPSGQCAVARP
jgi:hypothetical protein